MPWSIALIKKKPKAFIFGTVSNESFLPVFEIKGGFSSLNEQPLCFCVMLSFAWMTLNLGNWNVCRLRISSYDEINDFIVLQTLQGHACASETMERFPRKMDITSIELKPQAISVHIEPSGYSGWRWTVSTSSAHYFLWHEVQCVDKGRSTSPTSVCLGSIGQIGRYQ